MQTVLVVLLTLSLLTPAFSVCDATSEGQALLAVQRAYGFSANWSGQDPCAAPVWEGVNCSSDAHVIGLSLANMGLTGPLPSALGDLKYLRVLNLKSNAITGTIPASMANLTSLSNLTLSYNPLSGPFPSVLLQLTNLTSLKIDNTLIAGSLPAEIKNLQKLQQLWTGNNTNLKGPVPPELGLLTELLELSMWGNNLNSTLPNLGNCTKLRYLNFHDSLMVGSLPDSYGYLQNLTKVLLQNNGFTGTIPNSWSNLMPHIDDLELYANMFQGELPSFLLEQAHGVLSVYCNYFTGPEPADNKSVIYYNGNCFNEDPNAHSRYCHPTADCNKFYASIGESVPSSHSGTKIGVLLGAILGSVGVVVILLCMVGLYKWKKYKNRIPDYFHEKSDAGKGEKSTEVWEIPKGIRRFTIQELAKATKGFDKACHIGEGGFGQVYSGCLESETLVAIKRASPSSLQGHAEFRNELSLLSRLHHRHLVRLEGFCDDAGQQMLVYEFMKNGNLHTHLKGRRPGQTLNWYKRIEIALGVAQGLDYLHSFADPPVIHRDVKPSNILLDDLMVAKLSDFGISKVGNDMDTHISTRPAGTAGYLDPEYFIRRQLTTASDVYSFGVVLLVLITGQEAIDHKRPEEFNLVEWVKPRFANGGVDRIIDSRLESDYPREAFTTMADLALKCALYERQHRPSMKSVVNRLETLLEDLEPIPGDYVVSLKSHTASEASTSNTGTHSGDDSFTNTADPGGHLTITQITCR